MITVEQLNKLEELAKAATQKPWFVVSYETEDSSVISTMTKEEYEQTIHAARTQYINRDASKPSVSWSDAEILGSSEWLRALPADLDFIAAASPLVVLALLEQNAQLKTALDLYFQAANQCRGPAHDTLKKP